MFLVAPISSRIQFHEILTARDLHGVGVEVGAHRGEFTRCMTSQWKCERYYAVDPWDAMTEDYADSQGKYLWGGPDRVDDYMACAVVARDRPNVHMLKMTSMGAVPFVANKHGLASLDFVYLDGDHRREAVAADLVQWWSLLQPGGLMSGHDIVCPGPAGRPDDWGHEIQPAVIAFASHLNLPVYLVVEEGGLPWSYFMEKPK